VADSEISRIEGIAGSPSYMSPEQVQSIELTNRSDLYSLGAVMYELLTGTRPFRAGNLQKLLHQIVFATPPPIHTLRPEIPEELENVTAMALLKDPEKRYKTGLDFAAELTRVHQKLRAQYNDRPAGHQLRAWKSPEHGEIWEVLRASSWQDYAIPRRSSRKEKWTIAFTSSCKAASAYSASAGRSDIWRAVIASARPAMCAEPNAPPRSTRPAR
jgi:serine/threonine-protein kinase